MRAIRWLVVAGLCGTLAPLAGFAAPAWVPASPQGGALIAVTYSPSSPRIAYAADAFGGLIFRSEDDAVTWRRVGRLTGAPVVDLLVASDDPAIVYARNRQNQLLRSTDGGATWTALGADLFVTELVAEAHHPGSLLAAAPSQGVLRSTDRGDTWSVAALPGAFVLSIASSPFAEGTWFAVLGRDELSDAQSALRSTDGGLTWTAMPLLDVPTGFAEDQPHFVFDPAHPGTVFVFYDRFGEEDYAGPVLRSFDGGDTWTQPSEITLRDLVAASDGTLYGTTFFGVLISRDQGDTWGPMAPTAPAAPIDIIVRVAASPVSPGTVLAAGTQGLWKSTDVGGHWRNPSRGIPVPYPAAIAVTPVGPAKVLTLAGGRVFESTNEGHTWRRLHSEYIGPEPYTLTFDPRSADRIYGPTYNYISNFLVRSDTGGRTWRQLPFPYSCGGSLCSVDFDAFTLDPSRPDTLYASGTFFIHFVGEGSFFVRSRDGGLTWKNLTEPEDLIGLAVDPGRSNVVYGLAKKRLYKSEDEARTWVRVGRGLPLTGQRTLAIDPRDSRRLYVGTTRGIFASEDAGKTFHPLGEELRGREVDTILIDPLRPDRLYAAGAGIGVYRWDGRERRFTPLNDGLPLPQYGPFPLALDPREPATLYAGSAERGLLRLDLEESASELDPPR
ncbi:MAG TPA: hypothetical protein VN851_16070 [Thermoanaerobaculia bacterium]|nr:hypothetical protein [Thermoanaerobaculia bacterium]